MFSSNQLKAMFIYLLHPTLSLEQSCEVVKQLVLPISSLMYQIMQVLWFTSLGKKTKRGAALWLSG